MLVFLLVACVGGDAPRDPDGDGFSGGADCAEGNPDVYPGAPEYCGDDTVNDCDATEADARAFCALWRDVSAERASATIRGVASGQRVGAAIAAVGDADGVGDLAVGMPGDGEGGVRIVGGGTRDRVDASDAGVALRGEPGLAGAGTALSAPGDIDGDGFGDLVVAAPGARRTDEGRVYVELGPFDEARTLGGGRAWSGDGASATALAAGDVDGDGIVDVLAGAPEVGDGAVYVARGEGGALEDDARWLVGDAGGDALGAAVVAADLDGDGVADLVAGAPEADEARGAVAIVFGPFGEARAAGDADVRLVGSAAADRMGWAVASGGDVDGDGRLDLAVGATGAGGNGAAYLFTAVRSDAAAVLEGAVAGGLAGAAVSVLGDVDADGFDDLLVGAPGIDRGSGAAHLVLGPVRGSFDLADADATVRTAYDDVGLGSVLAPTGDLDGDGRADFALGAPAFSERGAAAGVAWVFLAAPI